MSIAEKLVTIAENEQKVYKAGQQAEYDTFWDNYQQNGNRTNYENAFAGYGWNAETFKPKYDIKPTSAYMLFRYCNLGSNFDLVEYLDNLGLTLDFSICTNVQYAFYGANIKRIGVIDFRNAEGSFATRALDSAYLETVDLLKVGEKNTTLDWFATARRLQNLTIEGVIVANLNVKACPLTHNSLMSIINALKDFSTLTTVTYHHGEYGNYSISENDFDPKGVEWMVTDAVLNGTTLICHGYNEDYNSYDVTITVTDINISAEDVAKIRTIQFNVASYNPETYEFIVDVVIKVSGEPTQFKTLTLGNENLLKLTESEKKKATDKGWILA